MQEIITFFLTFLLTSSCSFAQRILSKDEVFKNWQQFAPRLKKDSTSIVNTNDQLDNLLHKLVDSLHSSKVDSIIVFSTAYAGYASNSKCDTGSFNIETFVIWNIDGQTNIKKIKGTCYYDVIQNKSSGLFDFYSANSLRLKTDVFMPVIHGGKINKNNEISFTFSSVSHEPNYSFYYQIGDSNKSSHFAQSYIDNKESLFYDHNIHLATFNWWQIVKKELENLH